MWQALQWKYINCTSKVYVKPATWALIIFLAFLLAALFTIFLNSLAMSSLVIAPDEPRDPVGTLYNNTTITLKYPRYSDSKTQQLSYLLKVNLSISLSTSAGISTYTLVQTSFLPSSKAQNRKHLSTQFVLKMQDICGWILVLPAVDASWNSRDSSVTRVS